MGAAKDGSDLAPGMAEGVLSAAKNWKVFIVEVLITPPEATNTGPGFNRGSGGDARGCGVEERQGHMRVQRGVVSYSPRCLSVCRHYSGSWPFQLNIKHAHFPAQFSNTPNTRTPHPRCPWATRPIRARCPKRLPLVLVVVGAGGVCSKRKLPTAHNHHYHHHRRRRHHHHHLFKCC